MRASTLGTRHGRHLDMTLLQRCAAVSHVRVRLPTTELGWLSVVGHVGRVEQQLVVLRRMMASKIVKGIQICCASVLELLMMLRVVNALLLALLVRMRVLCRVIYIVVRTYSIRCSQSCSGAWVPPELTAPAGRRCLYEENFLKQQLLSVLFLGTFVNCVACVWNCARRFDVSCYRVGWYIRHMPSVSIRYRSMFRAPA
jgi:hypothetical protein